jgi:hypothetical protein
MAKHCVTSSRFHKSFSERHAWLLAFTLSVILCACATQESSTQQGDPSSRPTSMTMVSSFRSQVRVPKGARYMVIPPKAVEGSNKRMADVPMQAMIENAINKTLKAMGYVPGANADQSAFLVQYQLAMGDDDSGATVAEQYGVQPGLALQNPDKNAYEKGMLVIDIVQARSQVPIWNGAIQAFVTFDIPPEQREQRVNNAVFLLLRSFGKQ